MALEAAYLRQLELLQIRARRKFLGNRQGGHVSVKRGHGIEFSDYRQYELGDDPRHIDWGVFGRTDRLYVKQFQEEQDLAVLLVVDSSASMRIAEPEKWQRTIDTALSIAYVALMQQDRVMFTFPGAFVSPVYAGAKAIHNLTRDIAKAPVELKESTSNGLQRALTQIRFPGIAVVISDLLLPIEELREIFQTLRAKNLDIHAIQILGETDLNPLNLGEQARVVDSETGTEVELVMSERRSREYQAILDEHNTEVGDFLASAAIPYSTALPGQSTEKFIIEKLSRTSLFG